MFVPKKKKELSLTHKLGVLNRYFFANQCFRTQTFQTMESVIYIINKTFLYMLPIADHTAGPNGLQFWVDTHRWPGGVLG